MKRACVKLFIAAIIALGCNHAAQAMTRSAAADDSAIGGYYTSSVPDSAALLPNRSLKQHIEAMRKAHLDAIEGVWKYPDEMMTVAIERFSAPALL